MFALLAGCASQVGHICQKLAVNRETAQAKPAFIGERHMRRASKRASSSFFARLLRRPLWLAGLALELGAGTVFFLLAQVRLGPALIPGLMATGLILLAIDLSSFDILDAGFLVRAAAFSAAVTALFFALRLRPVAGRGAKPAIRGVSAALGSGLLYVLSNFWVGPFAGAVLRLFRGELGLPVWAMFAFGSAALMLTNLFGIAELQKAFLVSRAAVAVPLQTLPTQIAPGLVYLLVFRLRPPSRGLLWLFALGAGLIVASSFLIGWRVPAGESALRAGP